MSKVSVVMPVYNREKTVGQAIQSVLDQDFKDFELIIVDDGSTDKTIDIIKKIKDKRIKYHKQENKGEYPATNVGYKLAKGKYICLIHSDDLMLPKSLSLRVKALDENHKIDLVHGDVMAINFLSKEVDIREATNGKNSSKILKNCCQPENIKEKKRYFFQHVTYLFRKELFDKVGYMNEKLAYAGDLEWTLRMLKFAKVKRVPYLLYCYIRNEKSICALAEKKGIPVEKIIKGIKQKYCSQ